MLYAPIDCYCGLPMSIVTDPTLPSTRNYGEEHWECLNGHRKEIVEPNLVSIGDEDPLEAFWQSEYQQLSNA